MVTSLQCIIWSVQLSFCSPCCQHVQVLCIAGMQQLSLAASGLAPSQEPVMGDPALPIVVKESAWMMLMRITEARVLLFATGLRLRRFYKHLALHF